MAVLYVLAMQNGYGVGKNFTYHKIKGKREKYKNHHQILYT